MHGTYYIITWMNVAIYNLGLTIISIEDTHDKATCWIGFTTTQFMPHVLVTENIRIQ